MDYVDLTFHQVVQLCHDVFGYDLAEAIRNADSFSGMTAYGKVIKSGSGFTSTYQFPATYWTQNELRAVGVTSNVGRATDAWTSYVSSSGSAISSTTGGAKVALKQANSTTTGWIKKSATDLQRPSAYQASSILATPLPTVAAAAAPLLGVAVGASMYQENPELWTKLSQALVPWAYPDDPVEQGFVDINKGLMPVWTDVAEAGGELIARTLLPDFVVDAVKNIFEDEGIISESGYKEDLTKESVDGFIGNYSSAAPFDVILPGYTRKEFQLIIDTPGEGYMFKILKPSGTAIFCIARLSTSPLRWTLRQRNVGADRWSNFGSQTYNGVVYTFTGSEKSYAESPVAANDLSPYESAPDPGYYKLLALLRNIANTSTEFISRDVPGVQKWGSGSVYQLPQDPVQIVLQNPDGTERLVDAYPVPMPLTPGQSTDPSEQGIDDPISNPEKQFDPYVQDTADPYSLPAPTPENPSQPGPEVDPSQKSDPSNPISPSSPTPPPPPSDGSSPDPIPPVIPPPFTSEGGLIAIYNPTQSELIDFANWLWVTYQDATIEKIWNNPFDGVISLHELYATPVINGRRTIRSGFLDSEVESDTVARYSEINCGNIVIPEYWANYLDYAPYTKAFVYLPFIGIIELEADDIVGHSVNITYRVDAYNGSCIALITVAKQGPDGSVYNNTVYQYSGNCAVELPLTGGSQANIKAAIINATAWGLGSVIGGLVTASGTGPIAGLAGAGQAISGALQATASIVNAKSSVQHSGSFGASFGAMGIKKPYIIVKRPIQVQVLNYNEIYGYQAHKAVTIGSCEGYLRCREVHVASATANDEEKQLIEQYLKTGVIV